MGMIRINIFDELEPPKESSDGNEPLRSVSWLGGVNIPFSHVYINTTVEGVFRVEVPLMNMAYQDDPKARHFEPKAPTSPGLNGSDSSPLDSSVQDAAPVEHPMMIELFMTLNPPLIPPEQHVSDGAVPSQASPEFTHYAQKWLRGARSASNASNKNSIIAAAPDIAGRSIFLPCFITPLAPPVWESGGYETETHLLRLVSMIPFIEDWVAFDGDH